MRAFAGILLFTAIMLTTGCDALPQLGRQPSSDHETAEAEVPMTASARIRAVLAYAENARRIEPDDVARMLLEITWNGGGVGPIEMFEIEPNRFEIVVQSLPAGIPCALSIEALDADVAIVYFGSVTGVIFPEDQMLDLLLSLTASDSGVDEGMGPHIDTLQRPAADIPAGMVVELVFVVSDPDDDELTYALQSSGDGSFDAPTGTIQLDGGTGQKQVAYTSPSEPGMAEITLTITDAAGLSADISFALTIVEPTDPTLPGEGHVMLNFPPTVIAIHTTQAQDTEGLLVRAEVTDDGDLEGLTYAWDVDQSPYATGNPITHPSDVGTVTLTLSVTDAQAATTTLTFDLDTAATAVQDIPLGNSPPLIDIAMLSRLEASYGDTVACLIYATDPDSDSLVAEWDTDHGQIVSASVETQGEIYIFGAEWQADVAPGVAHVTVVVSDPDLATVTYTFQINQTMGRVGVYADASNDQEAFNSGTALLDGSASYSDDGVVEAYLWEQVSGPTSTIVHPEAEQTEVLLTAVGTYVYSLTVWNVNNEDSDMVEVLVIDPNAFSYTDAAIDQTGIIYFLDSTTDRVRRYDTVAETFLPSFSTASGLYRFAVAPEGDEVYVGYQGGRMDVIDAATAETSFFAAGPSTILRMAVVDGFIFTIDTSGAWETHSLYSRATGTRTFAEDWRNNSNGVAYAPSLARIFTFRDGTSPNDIIRTDVNLEQGTLGTDTDSPYHGAYSFIHPMRLFPDETRIAVASGVFFDTSDLTYAGSIGMGYKDLRFLGARAYVIQQIGSQTELTEMDLQFNILGSTTYAGMPLSLFAGSDALFLITAPQSGRVDIQKVVELEN